MAAERLNTKQAMARSGASRHALMRAKRNGLLWAESDNKGALLWDAEALDRWSAERPERADKSEPPLTEAEPEGPKTHEPAAALLAAVERAARAEGERDGLREALSAERARVAAAEADAARWRDEAVEAKKAAEAALSRRRFWPWNR